MKSNDIESVINPIIIIIIKQEQMAIQVNSTKHVKQQQRFAINSCIISKKRAFFPSNFVKPVSPSYQNQIRTPRRENYKPISLMEKFSTKKQTKFKNALTYYTLGPSGIYLWDASFLQHT